MRENDDDVPAPGPEGSLADGLGETSEPGGYESSGDPYGDTDLGDDSYGDDTDGTDDTYGADDTYGTDDTHGADDTYGTDETDGTYGDGDGSAVDDGRDADAEPDVDADVTASGDGSILGDDALLAQDNSPLEGIGFLIDEVREALLGEDDAAAAASPFDTEPGNLETDTDLDLTGDCLVDRADLHEAASSLDFDVSDGHRGSGHHDDGVMEA
jgi:hypothetical protein